MVSLVWSKCWLIALLFLSYTSYLTASSVQSLENLYRPSTANSLGSVSSPQYRQMFAQIWWEKATQESEEYHLLKYLKKRIFKGRGENQVVIADPGTSVSSAPIIDQEVLTKLTQNPEFLPQVASRFIRPRQWTFNQPIRSSIPKSKFEALSSDLVLKELLSTWSNEDDFFPATLEILALLRSSVNQAEWDRYRKLAVAIALVDDQIYPSNTPHSQVEQSKTPTPATPLEKFQDIIGADQSRILKRDVSKLSVGELFFLVAHKIAVEDLRWARTNRLDGPSDGLASKSFSSVKYSDIRVSNGQYSWPGELYTPANILLHGGICVDQAYYADLACKASGIPSMMFTGVGDEGGHAWVGFLTESGHWDVTVGRSGGVYLTGKTYNPQSWMPETDHDFSFFTSENSAPARLEANLATLFWDRGMFDKAVKAIDAASVLAPAVPSIWEKKIRYSSGTIPSNERSSGLKSSLRNKNLSPSVRATVKKELVVAERNLGRHDSARRFEKNIVDENSSSRSDISNQVIADRIQMLLEGGDVNKALSEYKIAIRNLPEGGKGDFFYNVARPLSGYLSDIGQRPQAMLVVRLARQKIKPPKDSLIDLDLREIEKRATSTKK